MSSIAIITARGGSKRIPRKNIREFMGRPMLAYAIAAARESGVFDEIMVSTDDREIAEIAKGNGAEVPFMRKAETADDAATTSDAVREVLGGYAELGRAFDRMAVVYPCVPFLVGTTLADAWRNFVESDADALLPVVRFHFPIQRAMRRTADGLLLYREPGLAQSRTQDLEPMYHDAGMFCLAKTRSFLGSGRLVAGHVVAYEMPEACVQDIDTMDDWRMAEIKFRMLNGA